MNLPFNLLCIVSDVPLLFEQKLVKIISDGKTLSKNKSLSNFYLQQLYSVHLSSNMSRLDIDGYN
jgi:hypothetical protein